MKEEIRLLSRISHKVPEMARIADELFVGERHARSGSTKADRFTKKVNFGVERQTSPKVCTQTRKNIIEEPESASVFYRKIQTPSGCAAILKFKLRGAHHNMVSALQYSISDDFSA